MAILERIVRNHEGLPLWFVERAARLAGAVGRIVVGHTGYGTGFLVAPNIVLTCQSVASDAEAAAQCTFELDYHRDEDGRFGQVTSVPLDPSTLFFANAALDFAFIGLVTPLNGRPTIPMTTLGDDTPGEWVSLIHHPRAGPMQLGVQQGAIVAAYDDVVHHTANSEGGSGGAPLLDERLRLIGLHHATVRRGTPQARTTPDDGKSFFIANEAIRTSAILRAVAEQFPLLLTMFDMKEGWTAEAQEPSVASATSHVTPAPAEVINANAKQRRDSVFISYAHSDDGKRKWRERLRTRLVPFGEDLDVWDDTRIQTGAEWRAEIEIALKRARVAVLLVGPAFLASKFIADHELPPLLEAAEKEGAVILPLITNDCSYARSKLAKYQSFNDPEKPLESMDVADQNRSLRKFAEEIDDAFHGRRAT